VRRSRSFPCLSRPTPRSYERLFTSSYARQLCKNNWPNSELGRFFWGWNCRGPAKLLCEIELRIWRASWGWQFGSVGLQSVPLIAASGVRLGGRLGRTVIRLG
jgi:hypothetical protein